MKIRSGFVSNSSTSSFIVMEGKLDTTARVALMMLSIILEEYEQDGFLDDSEVEDEMEEAINYLTDNIDYDKPICFPWGINYETFIRRDEDSNIHVDTSNNHSWWDHFDCEDADRENDDDGVEYLELSTMQKVGRKHYYRMYFGGGGGA